MSATTVELEVKEIIARLAKTTVDKIDTTRRANDYGIDSMGELEFRELLERKFQTYLDDRALASFSSIDDLVIHLTSRQESRVAKSSETLQENLDPNFSNEERKSRLRASGVLYEDVEIGMSLTCINNLAESPLMKYLGDLRWRHISALSGVPSKLFSDEQGRRLYPSFFYVEMGFPLHNPMAAYGENDLIKRTLDLDC